MCVRVRSMDSETAAVITMKITSLGSLITAEYNARSFFTSEVRVKGQICGERYSGIAAIGVKIVYHW